MLKIKLPFSQQGQGLIETLTILLFISVSVVALLQFQHYLSYSTSVTKQQSDAAIVATSQVETLRDFSVLTTQAGYAAYQDIVSGTGNTVVNNTTYTMNWTVTTNTDPDYKTIDVTVSWTDRRNVAQSVRLITQVAGIDPSLSAGF